MINQNKHIAPINWSQVERTGNNAIDIVAQAVGWGRSTKKPLKAIVLKPTSYDLFRAGLRILMAKAGKRMEDNPLTILTFDGVEIKRGGGTQFDTIRMEFYETMGKKELLN